MNALRVLIVATAASTFLLAGCAAPAEPPAVDLAAERTAIEQLIAEQLAANNQGGEAGADGYVSVASEDLVLLPPNGERVDGRQAVREWALQFTTAPGFSVAWEPTQIEVASSGDLAYALGWYETSLQDESGATVTDRGKFMDGFRKAADGTWEMTVIAFNSDLPVVGTTPASSD